LHSQIYEQRAPANQPAVIRASGAAALDRDQFTSPMRATKLTIHPSVASPTRVITTRPSARPLIPRRRSWWLASPKTLVSH